MKKHYKGILQYRVKGDHPDIKYIDNIEDVKTIDDIYSFDKGYSIDYINDCIINDLMLVAGGGYNTRSIYDTSVIINEISDQEVKQYKQDMRAKLDKLNQELLHTLLYYDII